MLHILEVSESFAPMWEWGGVARVSYDISIELAKQGNMVTVYTINRTPSYNIKDNVPINYNGLLTIRYFGMIRNKFVTKLGVVPTISIIKEIKKTISNFDIIHIHDYRSILSVIISHYARKYKIPYVVQAHGALPKIDKRYIKSVFDKFFGKNMLQKAKATIALSKTEKDTYMDFGVNPENVHIIPNGINRDFYPIPHKNKFRENNPQLLNKKIIVFTGRLHHSKGVDLLIKAFAKIHHSDESTHLLLVGPNSDNTYMKSLMKIISEENINDAVTILGFVSTDEKKEILVDSDVFVTPSYSGFPATFIEACACTVPIVTTKKGDVLEWIDNNVGYVTEYTVESLSQGILSILNNPNLAEKFKQKELELVQNEFAWTKIVDKLYHTVYS